MDEQGSSHDAGCVRKELGSLAGEEVAVWKAGVAVSNNNNKKDADSGKFSCFGAQDGWH